MSYDIHLSRFEKNYTTEISITEQEWLSCLNELEQIRIVTYDYSRMVEGFSENYQDWKPVFWIREDGSGFARSSGFFESDIAYEKAIEIATYFQAFIYGDEGEIYFMPEYGIIFDDVELENPLIYLFDLEKYEKIHGKDYSKIIEFAAQERLKEKEYNAKLSSEPVIHTVHYTSSKSFFTYGIIAILVLISISLLLYIILNMNFV